MREIKVKAWDKQRHEWVKQTGNPYIFPFEGRVAMICAGSSTGHISDEDYSEFYELVQYTNLKDKHFRDIYEGDILCYKFHKKHHVFKVEIPDIYYKLEAGYFYTDLSEIIANIYENPELMKER